MSRTPAVQRLLRTWLKFSAANKFDDATWTPREAQEKKLLEIVGRNKDTAFGRDHGFGGIKSIEDYRSAVPMNTYETLTPYIDRVFAGEKNVLTADDPLMFATTSGTTGRAKYIPVTPSYLHEYSHGVHVHLYRIFTDFGDALEGKILVSSSSDEEGRSDGGLPYGAISGYLARKQPGAIKRFYALPYELSKVKEVESKYYLTLRYGAAADVRLLMTPNPSSLLLLADKLNVWAEELIHDIRKGGANPAYVPDGSPKALTAGLTAESGARRRAPGDPEARRRADADRGLAEPAPGQLLEGRHDAALPAQAAGRLRGRAGPRPRLHGERGPGRDAARQLRRRRRAQRDEPLLRVRPGGAARRSQPDLPHRATSSSRTASTTSTSRPRPACIATTSTTSSGSSTSTGTHR